MHNQLVPLLVRHGLAGAAAGWVTVGLLLWTDTAGIGLLVAASDLWPIPLIMLFWSFGVTFGSVAMGAAVMGIHRRAEPRSGASERRGFGAASRVGFLRVASAPHDQPSERRTDLLKLPGRGHRARRRELRKAEK